MTILYHFHKDCGKKYEPTIIFLKKQANYQWEHKHHPQINNTRTTTNTHVSITLNINGLNPPIKRHRLTRARHKIHLSTAYKKYISVLKISIALEQKGRQKYANGIREQAGTAILESGKIDFKLELIRRDKETLHSNQGNSWQLNDTNIHASNSGVPNPIKTLLLELKINNNPFIGDFNAPLSPIDRLSAQTVDRESRESDGIIHQMDLSETYRIIHTNTKGHTFYSAAQGQVSKTDHILGYKTNLEFQED